MPFYIYRNKPKRIMPNINPAIYIKYYYAGREGEIVSSASMIRCQRAERARISRDGSRHPMKNPHGVLDP